MGSAGKVKKDKLPFWYTPAWSSRSMSVGISIVVMMQVTFYSTNVLGLSSGLVGTIFLLSKIFDGVTDLFAGFMVDRTNTKIGKARPYELVLIPLWLLIVLFFSTPDMGKTATIIYIFVMYTLINSICLTFLQASETVYLGRAIEDHGKRGKILSVSGVIVMMGSAIGSMALPQLMNSWGTQPGGWTKIALVYAIPLTIIGLVRFFCIKETKMDTEEQKKNKIGFKESIVLLLKNKYILVLAGLIFFSNLAQNMISIVASYYYAEIMGNLGLMSLVGMLGMLTPFIFLLFPVAMRTVGAVGFVKIGLALGTIACFIRFLFPTTLPVLMVSVMFSGIGISTVTMMNSFFILQCIDYGELKSGKRVEGVPTALCNFTSKIGSGIASAAVGLIMGAAGYIGTATEQTAGALSSIRSLYSLIPGIICIIMLILLRFYDVEKKLSEMKSRAGE